MKLALRFSLSLALVLALSFLIIASLGNALIDEGIDGLLQPVPDSQLENQPSIASQQSSGLDFDKTRVYAHLEQAKWKIAIIALCFLFLIPFVTYLIFNSLVVKRLKILESLSENVDSEESENMLKALGDDEISSVGQRVRALGISLHTSLKVLRHSNQRLELQASERTQALRQEIGVRREAEKLAQEKRDEAELANASKSDFLATMSHEIRTPMNGVIGMAGLLSDTKLDDEQRSYVASVSSSAESLLSIINGILDLSKIEAGLFELDCVDFSLPSLLSELCEPIKHQAVQKGLAFELQIDAGLPVWVNADPVRIRQVLLNFLSNALKFTSRGFVHLRAFPCEGGRVSFEVVDSGGGIEDSRQEGIFEPFTQEDSSTTRRFGGTGLGLSICKHLADMMEGEVSVRSEKNKGSSFVFSLPLAEAAPKASEEAAESVASSLLPEPQGAPPRILVAEDNEVNQQLIKTILKKGGFEAEIAEDGEAAVSAWQEKDYELILMDVNMPKLDGLEATREIRRLELKSGGHIPIIALTANAVEGAMEECLEAGMDDYLSKPFKRALIFSMINTYLATAQPVDDPSCV